MLRKNSDAYRHSSIDLGSEFVYNEVQIFLGEADEDVDVDSRFCQDDLSHFFLEILDNALFISIPRS